MKNFFRLALGGLGLASLLVCAPRLYTALRYAGQLVSVSEAPVMPTAIIFGAGLWRDGSPTPVLYDRVATGVALYQAGKVKQLLMSGDGTTNRETVAMRRVALEMGVPEEAIVLDAAGLRTYDSCLRARDLYGATQVLLVTQQFHLPRALFICEALGLEAVGVIADRRQYNRVSLIFTNLREVLATANAVLDITAQ